MLFIIATTQIICFWIIFNSWNFKSWITSRRCTKNLLSNNSSINQSMNECINYMLVQNEHIDDRFWLKAKKKQMKIRKCRICICIYTTCFLDSQQSIINHLYINSPSIVIDQLVIKLYYFLLWLCPKKDVSYRQPLIFRLQSCLLF